VKQNSTNIVMGSDQDVVYNVFYSSVKKIRRNVQAFIRELNDTPEKVIDRLCVQL
jgi:hypothetical protein